MRKSPRLALAALVCGVAALAAVPALARDKSGAHSHAHGHSHAHSHAHADDKAAKDIYAGYFEDAQVKPRKLSDWRGEWRSVYPYLLDGTLDPVMEKKARSGDKTAAQHRAYYETGYKTDVDRIVIKGDKVAFHRAGGVLRGVYAPDGQEVLTYAKGNRGVRYVFRKTGGDAAAPGFIQFSDHKIAPQKADHYHLYWGDDRAALLKEVTNWPTYYPAALSRKRIVEEMLAH